MCSSNYLRLVLAVVNFDLSLVYLVSANVQTHPFQLCAKGTGEGYNNICNRRNLLVTLKTI